MVHYGSTNLLQSNDPRGTPRLVRMSPLRVSRGSSTSSHLQMNPAPSFHDRRRVSSSMSGKDPRRPSSSMGPPTSFEYNNRPRSYRIPPPAKPRSTMEQNSSSIPMPSKSTAVRKAPPIVASIYHKKYYPLIF